MPKARKERPERAQAKRNGVAAVTASEATVNEMKHLLGDVVRKLRRKNHLSQSTLARMMGSSQPRIAKLENRDPQVSMDLQLRAIFAANPAARHDVAALIHKWSGFPTAVAAKVAAAPRSPAAPGRRSSRRPAH
jgi:DNA-binding transcriptional regulator YiaG